MGKDKGGKEPTRKEVEDRLEQGGGRKGGKKAQQHHWIGVAAHAQLHHGFLVGASLKQLVPILDVQLVLQSTLLPRLLHNMICIESADTKLPVVEHATTVTSRLWTAVDQLKL